MRTRRLVVDTPEGERELLFIGRLTVGRAAECDISLADTKISRRHAEFDATGPAPRVTDLGSRNGILVNGRKVGSAELSSGDVVTVGDARIRVEDHVTVPEPAASGVATDDRTAVLAAPVRPARSARDVPVQETSPVDDDRTAVIPRVALAAAGSRPPVGAAAVAASDDRTVILSRPPAAAIAGPARAVETLRAPAPAPAPPTPVSPAPAARDVLPSPAAPPVAAPSEAPPVAARAGSPAVASGPRMSWGGLVTLCCVLLGGLAVLLGAFPLISASSASLDALSRRQARTLAGWLASGMVGDGTGPVDERVLSDVLAQPGVETAMVLDTRTGRALAPARLAGRPFAELPGIGDEWRDLASPLVGVTDTFVDAYVPVRSAAGAYVVWVRYTSPSASENGIAVVVALAATLVFGLVIGIVIKRHTAATLQYFTRQVELAVAGAGPKVMQGHLMPGLERLPGVVAYLLEQRRAGGGLPASEGRAATGSAPGADADVSDGAAPGPAWIEITPALTVAAVSPHAPASGVRVWSAASGRHLLDVLEPGPICNAVVQGLGALGTATGAEVVVPVPGCPQVTLRRENTTHVRVELAGR